ncbi:DUF418 domain-containing protein [Marinicauda salina]|nr:DUF418 domain-containing protein [Marinicauda salina]
MSTTIAPVSAAARFESLDALRGVAVLGILMMNVQAFLMHPNAYQYPPAHMDLSGANETVWFLSHVFFEMKFITIFSALFGAGIVLMVGEASDAPLGLHYRRMIWLLGFGLVHAYAFWYGDILVSYAAVGMVAVLFRAMPASKLILWGAFWIAVTGLLMLVFFGAFALSPETLDPVETGMAPSAEDLAHWVAAYQAGFWARLPGNAVFALFGELFSLTLLAGRLVGVMFVGMALFKTGFLTLQWRARAYAAGAAIGLGIGLPLVWFGGRHAVASQFALDEMWVHMATNYFGSLAVAFGYAALIMLVCKPGWLRLARLPFAAAGRMAFTNYLTQTLIMTFIAVGGIGLGYYGRVERIDQVKIVLAVWIVQLVVSTLWLRFFRFGPFEWAWRSLSYGRVQPFLRDDAERSG